ncbi:MAG: response regulator [Labilithrix sp.]|nr:response regulator [Labilithrix sp.]MBX3221396.1 response regulator [Labilithrix sp.]
MASSTNSTPPLQSGRHPKYRSVRPGPPSVASSPCILVIDDDDMVRRALVRGLRRKYAVTDLRDAETARALITAGTWFDAILCDLNLAGMSGADFFVNLQALDEQQASRVVILSGNPDGREDPRFAGREPRFLEKPSSIATIEAMLVDLFHQGARAA